MADKVETEQQRIDFAEMILASWPAFAHECGSCNAFRPKAWTKGLHFATAGECRRYAPTPNINPDILWPKVMATDGCLEYLEDADKKKAADVKKVSIQKSISKMKKEAAEEPAAEKVAEAPSGTTLARADGKKEGKW
jgi:hypothetical protein